jgi:hypothetical protein
MRVWVYPEKVYENFGATRWQLSWEELRKSAEGKEEIDYDTDIIYRYQNFKDKDSAMKVGRELVEGGKTLFGAASVVEQRVDWEVEEDRIAEWKDCTFTEEHID